LEGTTRNGVSPENQERGRPYALDQGFSSNSRKNPNQAGGSNSSYSERGENRAIGSETLKKRRDHRVPKGREGGEGIPAAGAFGVGTIW